MSEQRRRAERETSGNAPNDAGIPAEARKQPEAAEIAPKPDLTAQNRVDAVWAEFVRRMVVYTDAFSRDTIKQAITGQIEQAEAAAFRRGQERMRERIAARLLLVWPGASRKARQMEIEEEAT